MGEICLPEYENKGAFNKKGKMDKAFFSKEFRKLQIELIKLQNWVKERNKKVMIVFEGRDAAGKGSAIKRLSKHLNPRGVRAVALGKPSDVEKCQWYFERYISQLPDCGEIVFFDRSWYNRAGVERVMGFCTPQETEDFLLQAPILEQMFLKGGIVFFKYFLDIGKEEQKRRLKQRQDDPLKQWKLSPIDLKAQELWDEYTKAYERMFSMTHSAYSPWVIVRANDKKRAHLNILRDILGHIDYEGKDRNICLKTDPEILRLFSHLKEGGTLLA